MKRLASKVEPAHAWRRNLAKGLSNATGGPFVAVYTCPPDELLESVHAIFPEEKEEVGASELQRLLPKIVQAVGGAGGPPIGGAHRPLERDRSGSLRALLRPMMRSLAVDDLIHSAFHAEGKMVGGATVGLPEGQGAPELLEELTEVARIAGRTLEAALALAKGCGAEVDPEPTLELEALSPRERQVASLAAQGMTDLNIAKQLLISEQTVGAHLRRIFLKLEINSRLQLAHEPRLRRARAHGAHSSHQPRHQGA